MKFGAELLLHERCSEIKESTTTKWLGNAIAAAGAALLPLSAPSVSLQFFSAQGRRRMLSTHDILFAEALSASGRDRGGRRSGNESFAFGR